VRVINRAILHPQSARPNSERRIARSWISTSCSKQRRSGSSTAGRKGEGLGGVGGTSVGGRQVGHQGDCLLEGHVAAVGGDDHGRVWLPVVARRLGALG
jgi:hypothetical protein